MRRASIYLLAFAITALVMMCWLIGVLVTAAREAVGQA